MNSQELFKKLDVDEFVQWELIFETLSVERVELLLPEMGLQFLNADVIRYIARQFLEEIEGLDDNIEKEKQLLLQVFIKIEKETNDEIAGKLYQWGKWIFTSKRQSGLFFWASLLCWLAGLYNTQIPIVKPILDQQKLEAIVEFVRKEFADDLDLEQRIADAEKLPKSAWEEKVYRKSEDEYSPLTLASNSIRDYKTQKIWNFIQASLSQKEIEMLLRWGKNNAKHFRFNQDLINIPPVSGVW